MQIVAQMNISIKRVSAIDSCKTYGFQVGSDKYGFKDVFVYDVTMFGAPDIFGIFLIDVYAKLCFLVWVVNGGFCFFCLFY